MAEVAAAELAPLWFRTEDLFQFSKLRLVLTAVEGGLLGYLASVLLLVYFAPVTYDLLIYAVVAISSVSIGAVGLFRNDILRRIALHGYAATFRFQRIISIAYVGSIISGIAGIVVSKETFPQSKLVLPLVVLFFGLLYPYLLWSRVLKPWEEGRLSIYQFLTEENASGVGYSWLERGLRAAERRLNEFGVSTRRNSLFFGASYSLLEGSSREANYDALMQVGDWVSQPNETAIIRMIMVRFLSNEKQAKHGASREC